MTRTVLAIIAIFLCTTAAWAILGATIMARTYSADSDLQPRVSSSWGGPHQQAAPLASTSRTVSKLVHETVGGQTVSKTVQETLTSFLPLERSRVRVEFDLEQRQKGLLWFPTYRVAFHGQYLFRNNTPDQDVMVKLGFPSAEAIYDDLVFRVDGQAAALKMEGGTVSARVRTPAGAVIPIEIGYRSQGLGTWHYSLGDNIVQVRDFLLEMSTDFHAIDFPLGTLSPTVKTKTAEGWLLSWKYTNLVTGFRIGMEMPEKLQPGPLAGRISYFAPVSLLFFFFMIFIITTLKRIDLHPMHYFFLATSFSPSICCWPIGSITSRPRGLPDLLGGVDLSGGELSENRGGVALRFSGSGTGAAHLSGGILLCFLLQRFHGAGGDHRRHPLALRSHADDRPHRLAKRGAGQKTGGVSGGQ